MLVFSSYVHRILESDDPNVDTHKGKFIFWKIYEYLIINLRIIIIFILDIFILTAIFFLFTFLSATQDIAVDGWGLTILSKYIIILS